MQLTDLVVVRLRSVVLALGVRADLLRVLHLVVVALDLRSRVPWRVLHLNVDHIVLLHVSQEITFGLHVRHAKIDTQSYKDPCVSIF